MVFNVYEFKGNFAEQSKRDFLFSSAMRAYLSELGMEDKTDIANVVHRTDKGKPYFPYGNIKFNISHSDDYWVCIIGQEECGIDIQKIKPTNCSKLASRFFTQNEEAYVSAKGILGFFGLWTRREAFAKFTGEGFFSKMPEFVDEDMELLEEVSMVGSTSNSRITAYLRELNVSEDTVCVYCTGRKDDEIRVFTNRYK